MPDGDKIHSKLSPRYQRAYKWICEAKADPAESARLLMKALKKTLQTYGDSAIKLIQNIASEISGTMEEICSNNFPDWRQVNLIVQGIVFQSDGSHVMKELVNRAVNQIFHEQRYNNPIKIEQLSQKIIQSYIAEVYDSTFKGKVPLTEEHYGGISFESFNTNLI